MKSCLALLLLCTLPLAAEIPVIPRRADVKEIETHLRLQKEVTDQGAKPE
jgi:hypothetical protein